VNVVILVNESIKVTDSPAVNNTSSGNNVAIKPVDTTSGTSPVSLTFTTVTQPGLTSLTTSTNGPPPPTGFQLGNPAEYYNLTTTAGFTGTILVCINYAGISFVTPPGPRLFHFENGSWVDTTNMIVCGSVTSLSPFALFRLVNRLPIAPATLRPSPGVTTITFFGTDNAGNVETAKSVTIRLDKTPPTLFCNASPNQLWPPDNKLTPINVSVN
jgi:hypothetical protein